MLRWSPPNLRIQGTPKKNAENHARATWTHRLVKADEFGVHRPHEGWAGESMRWATDGRAQNGARSAVLQPSRSARNTDINIPRKFYIDTESPSLQRRGWSCPYK